MSDWKDIEELPYNKRVLMCNSSIIGQDCQWIAKKVLVKRSIFSKMVTDAYLGDDGKLRDHENSFIMPTHYKEFSPLPPVNNSKEGI